MRNEYPRPDFVRKEWLSLNGLWKYETGTGKSRDIQVPFVPQSSLSGIGESPENDRMTYRRAFTVPSAWRGKNILLRFGAVDYRCRVLVNGKLAVEHEGGQTPFAADITELLGWGEEQLEVQVEDPSREEAIPRGKQSWTGKSHFIWYTPSSGIWQSVWLEPVADTAFASLRFTPDVDSGSVEIRYALSPTCPLPVTARFTVSRGQEEIYRGEILCREHEGRLSVDVFSQEVLKGYTFSFSTLCWSPERPTLYDVKAEVLAAPSGEGAADTVSAYFGMRKISVEDGRVFLNNLPYYQKLLLDQGYWPDGLLTAPSDEAFQEDIAMAKAMGFNGVRKHEKVEDPRYLYWADKMGFLVWEAMASFYRYTPESVARFTREWCDVIRRDYNHPCIVVWGMLNESWGVPNIYLNREQQHFAQSLYHLAHGIDSTRLVISNDGWEQVDTDICALHSYRHGEDNDSVAQARFAESLGSLDGLFSGNLCERMPWAKGFSHSGQPVLLTECGGVSDRREGDAWGYTSAVGEGALLNTYRRIIDTIYSSPDIFGFCYTQLTDVEQETNGLLTYSREFKCDPAKIKEINDRKAW